MRLSTAPEVHLIRPEKHVDETAWRSLDTAPRDWSWIQGRGASDIPRLMRFARKEADDETSRIAAELLFGPEDPVW